MVGLDERDCADAIQLPVRLAISSSTLMLSFGIREQGGKSRSTTRADASRARLAVRELVARVIMEQYQKAVSAETGPNIVRCGVAQGERLSLASVRSRRAVTG